ncbi:MAG: hypothetical protein WBP93_12315 [Pyrinomonadaceae bacterium]
MMSDSFNCFRCGYTTDTPTAQCPRCGRRLRSASQVRAFGVLLVVLGGFLVIAIGGISILVVGAISQTGKSGSSARFTGGPGDVLFIFGIFGLVFSFGLASIAGGVWQILFGRANKILSYLILGLGAIFFIIGTVVKSLG